MPSSSCSGTETHRQSEIRSHFPAGMMRTVHCSTLFHSTATQPESDVCDVSIPEMSKSVRLALKTKYSGSILTPECWSIDFHLDDNMPASVSRRVSWSGRCQRDGCTASQRVENAVHCSVACVRLGVLSRHARQLNGSALRALSLHRLQTY